MGALERDAPAEGVGSRPDLAPRPHQVALGSILAERYRLKSLLGRGGMASVYRADDESLGRAVALKIFHPGLAHAQDARRQREETTLLASFNHPGLVTLFDASSDNDQSFLVMELVDGPDLRVRMRSGALDSRATALIGADVASALSYIHAKGVIHRDVKPANILLPEGATEASHSTHAKLADFGIARLIDSTHLTAAGSLIGTASYLSPEQAEGGAVGSPSDVYSLTLILLECLTGQPAFDGTAAESTFARLNSDPSIPAGLGSAWATLLRWGTSRDATARPTAQELSRELRQLAASEVTMVLPVATMHASPDEQVTAVLAAPAAPAAPAAATAAMPARASAAHITAAAIPARASAAGIRTAVIIVAVFVVVGLGVLGLVATQPWQALGQLFDSLPSSGTIAPDYPAVDGELGTHLGQLQESVAP